MKQMDNESIEYMEQYVGVSERVKKYIENHADKYGLNPKICAWYKDTDNFYDDWVLGVGYSTKDADLVYDKGIESGEFLWLPDGLGLVRFEL